MHNNQVQGAGRENVSGIQNQRSCKEIQASKCAAMHYKVKEKGE